MDKKIKLLVDVKGYMITFKKGDEFECDEPYQGFNANGTFTICHGFGTYTDVKKEEYEVLD